MDIACRASSERIREVQCILKTAREIQRLEREVADAKRVERFRLRVIEMEEVRQHSVCRALEQRTAMQRQLIEQKAAITERTTKVAQTRTEV